MASSSLSTAIEFTGEGVSDNAGSSVATGDMNNDGIDDVIIGAYSYSESSSYSDFGAAYVVLGRSTWSRSTYPLTPGIGIRKFIGKAYPDAFGYFVGYFESISTTPLGNPIPPKLIVGALHNNDGGSEAGQVWLIDTLPGRAVGYQRTVH